MSLQNLDLLDATLDQDENPHAVALAQLKSCHDKSGSTWLTRNTTSIQGAWYARDEQGNQYLAHPDVARSEVYLAHWMRKRLTQSCDQIPIVPSYGGLTAAQSEAARLILGHKVACLSGLPGTGKTYTMRSVCRSLEK